ncbi:MAG: hypothetical protein ACLFVD_07755 [Dehalococcoidia bacterium]
MDLESEVRDIKEHIIAMSRKLDELVYEREVSAMTRLAERSLSEFLEDEPSVYRIEDLRVRYR